MIDWALPLVLLLLALAPHALRAAGGCQTFPRNLSSYQRVEIHCPDNARVENPDDVRQAEVEAVFVSPSGRQWRMPGFFYRDYRLDDGRFTEQGQPEWRVRFTPAEAGTWKARVRLKIGAKNEDVSAGEFRVTAAKARGFLRRSAANPLALEYDNGEPLIAIGGNPYYYGTTLGKPLPAGRSQEVIHYMEKIAAAGGTFCRLRMDGRYIPLEMTPDPVTGYQGIGHYHGPSAWEIDQIVNAAERLNLTLMLCVDDALLVVDEWFGAAQRMYNFYRKENGGPLADVAEFWTDPEVARYFKQKMRYCVARWGASPAIGVWQFFNEVKLKPDAVDKATRWHADMAAYWRRQDPWKRPVSTSLQADYRANRAVWQLWDVPELDVISYHSYATDQVERFAEADPTILRQNRKPLFIGEFGPSNEVKAKTGGSARTADPTGLHMHNGIWAAGLTGAVGALEWWFRGYTETLDLYHIFTGYSRFTADWKINKEPWTPFEAQVDAPYHAYGMRGGGQVRMWIYNSENTYAKVALQGPPKSSPPAQIVITGLAPGAYEVEWWDTWKGEPGRREKVEGKTDSLVLRFPGTLSDVACKIRPQR